MCTSPIDVCPTMSGHLYLIIIQHLCLIDQTHTRAHGGRQLSTDGCWGVPNIFPTHNQIPKFISGSRPSFHAYLNQHNKTSRHKSPITSQISRWLVTTPNLVLFVPIAMSKEHVGAHTHTFAHVYTICSPQHTTHKKWDFVEPNGGRSRET